MLRPQRARSASGASAGGALETGGAPLVSSSVSDLELRGKASLAKADRAAEEDVARGIGIYSQVETTRPVHPSEGRLKPGPDFFSCLVFVFAVMLAATLSESVCRECK